MPSPPGLRENVPLAPLTTFELGGPARWFLEAAADAAVVDALRWAREAAVPVFVLGGGSNLVVPDEGFPGLVLRIATRGVAFGMDGAVDAAAGEPWDPLVEATVARDLQGLECLSGIPGLTGATPIQNVGAYGQEVAETIRAVRVLDRHTLAVETLDRDDCAFAYRDSIFKRQPDRAVVLGVTFALTPDGPPALRYPELRAAVTGAPSLADTRAAVLALRRRKSMVIDAADPNRRSAGSFFTNPLVPAAVADALGAQHPALPRFPAGAGQVKLSAGWLIDRAGLKGFRDGAVGVSDRHALALVHHGGGTTAALLALARHVRDTVRARFGVVLTPEPLLLGRRWDDVLG